MTAAEPAQGAHADDFGPPKQSFIRRRPYLSGCLVLIALPSVMILWYLLMLARVFMGQPTIATDYTIPLSAQALAVPADEAGLPLYAEGSRIMRDEDDADLVAWEATDPGPEWEEDWLADTSATPEDPEAWAKLIVYVEERSEAIELIVRATQRPGAGFIAGGPVDADIADAIGYEPEPPPANGEPRMLIDVLLPMLGEYRSYARLLAADARIAAAEGDSARFTRSLLAFPKLARDANEQNTLINQLVGYAILNLAAEELLAAIERTPEAISTADLARLADGFSEGSLPPLRVDLSGERDFFADLVQRMYTDNGKGDGHFTAAGSRRVAEAMSVQPVDGPGASVLLGPFAAGRAEILAEYADLMDQIQAAMDLPVFDDSAMDSVDAYFDAKFKFLDPGRMMISVMIPATGRLNVNSRTAASTVAAARAAIALELFRRENGSFPGSLDELPGGPGAVGAICSFTNEPLVYRPPAEARGVPTLYSIGRDMTDHSGTPMDPDIGTRDPDYDLVFLPRPVQDDDAE